MAAEGVVFRVMDFRGLIKAGSELSSEFWVVSIDHTVRTFLASTVMKVLEFYKKFKFF